MASSNTRQELREVKDELIMLEHELEELLERQQHLMAMKEQLEQALHDESASTTSHNSTTSATDWSKTDFPWCKKLIELRDSVFNIHTFRPLQLQTMNSTLSGKDCILIMPTGGGKSLCFQLTALISEGVTLVVTPLVSLMEDQLMALHRLGLDAAMLNASSTRQQVKDVQDAMVDKKGTLKLLYCTPEKLAKSKRFMAKLEKMYSSGRFARLVIDEVHCCSQWGHDFRPDYKFLGVLRKQFPEVPILGLTATATNDVVQDVKKILGISQCLLFRASFNRHNLYFEVRNKQSAMKDTIEDMQKLIKKRFTDQSGIVYCLTQKDSEEVTQQMQQQGIKAGCYHAGLDSQQRSYVHKRWMNNQLQVVVATIAFGMGIDKANVRFVIHFSISKSMENYYQESGRAGRDSQPAHCVLYSSYADIFRQSTMVFTEQTGLDKLYGMVRYANSPTKCRRSLIAKHFGEQWDPINCKEMCDHCDPEVEGEIVTKDVSVYAKNLMAILKNAKEKDQRLTGLKLLESWLGKGSTALRLSYIKPPELSRQNAEKLIIELILRDFLKEDFHFTPYSTISYVVPGPKARMLQSDGYKIEMEFLRSGNPSVTSLKKKKSAKPKVVVVNKQKSIVVNNQMMASLVDTGIQSKDKEPPARKKKRKIVIESDEDSDEDFDFGDIGGHPVSVPSKKNRVGIDKKAACVLIDSDSGEDMPEVGDFNGTTAGTNGSN